MIFCKNILIALLAILGIVSIICGIASLMWHCFLIGAMYIAFAVALNKETDDEP